MTDPSFVPCKLHLVMVVMTKVQMSFTTYMKVYKVAIWGSTRPWDGWRSASTGQGTTTTCETERHPYPRGEDHCESSSCGYSWSFSSFHCRKLLHLGLLVTILPGRWGLPHSKSGSSHCCKEVNRWMFLLVLPTWTATHGSGAAIWVRVGGRSLQSSGNQEDPYYSVPPPIW